MRIGLSYTRFPVFLNNTVLRWMNTLLVTFTFQQAYDRSTPVYATSYKFRSWRICFLLSLLCTNMFCVTAQKLLLTQKVEINVRKDDFAVVGKYRSFDVAYRMHYGEADLLFYDTLGVIQQRALIPGINSNCSNLQFQCHNQGLCIYYEEKSGSKYTLKAVRLISDTLFSEPKEIGSYERSFFKDKNEFQFAISEDQSKVLCYNYALNNDNIALQAYVMNERLEEVSTVNQLFERDKLRFLSDQVVYNNGTAQLLCTADLDVRGGSSDLLLLECQAHQTLFTSNPFSGKEKYFTDMLLYADNSAQTTHVAAYYCEGKFSGPKGIYYTRYQTAFSGEPYTLFLPLSLRSSKNKADLRDIHFKQLSLLTNGNIEIIAEKFYKSTRMISSAPMPGMVGSGIMNSTMDYSRSVTEYNYDEIAIFHISPEGKLKWNQNVLKSQQSTDDGGIYSSYGLLESKLGKAYVFNDMERRSDKLMVAYLSSKGILSLKQLPTTEEIDNMDIMPRSSVQTGANEIVMPCTSKNYLCLLKIRY